MTVAIGTPPQNRAVPKRLVVLLGVLAAFGPLATDMYLPALPRISGAFHVSNASAQLTLTISLVGLAVGQLFIGPWSDRLGRRRLLLAGVAAFAVFSFGCAVSSSLIMLLICRLGQAFGASTGVVISRAICRDLTAGPALERLLSTLQLVSGLAPTLAPLIGGQLLRLGSWRLVFVVLTALGVALFVGVAGVIPETRARSGLGSAAPVSTASAYLQLLRDRRLVGYVLVGGLAFAALFVYIANSTFILQQRYGLSPTEFSIVFAVNAIGLMIGGRIRLASIQRKLSLGLGVLVVASVLLLAVLLSAAPLGLLLAGFFLLAFGYGLCAPSAVALALAEHPRSAGAAAALFGGFQYTAGGIAAPIAGLGGAGAALGVTLLVLTSTAFGLAVLQQRHRPRPTP